MILTSALVRGAQWAWLLALAAAAAAAAEDPLCGRCDCSKAALLNCTGQGLQKLPLSADAWPADIEEALFDHNGLLVLEKIPPLPRLRRLSLRHNLIQHIDNDCFANLTALRELDLASNELTRHALTPHVFRGPYDRNEFQPLVNLTVLRLDSNSIHSLSSDFFMHVTHIRELSLAFNPIRVIDTPTLQAISSLAHLQVLDLTHIGVSSLQPYMLFTLLNLTSLNLSANAFTQVPQELENAHQLKELVLSSNPIAALDAGAFPESLRSLETLRMDYMHNLTRVGAGALAPLKGLRALRLLHSPRLHELHVDAFVGAHEAEGNATYPPLEELVLRGNGLRTLDRWLLARWDNLKQLDLEDNRWLCDCHLQWVVEELEPIINATNPSLLRNFVCEDPLPMRGVSIFGMHARRYSMRCLDADGAQPQGDGLVLVGVLVGVLLAVPATLMVVLCLRRRSFSLCPTGPAAYSRAFYRQQHNDVDDF